MDFRILNFYTKTKYFNNFYFVVSSLLTDILHVKVFSIPDDFTVLWTFDRKFLDDTNSEIQTLRVEHVATISYHWRNSWADGWWLEQLLLKEGSQAEYAQDLRFQLMFS